MSLRVRAVTKYHGRGSDRVLALDQVDLEVDDAELLVLLGPSGAGKTTLLRVIVGLDRAESGTVEVGGRDVTGVPVAQRSIAMVFQDLALYPHLTVAGNLHFDLRAGGIERGARDQAVRSVVERLGLEGLVDRRPAQLSGGERQRMALARALVRRPALLLLDEPLSNIDVEHRSAYRRDLRRHQRDLGLTTVHVTHDTTEAMTLADRIAVLDEGRVLQQGTPREVWARPVHVAVARRFGDPPMNLLDEAALFEPGRGLVGVRPEDLLLITPGAEPPSGARVLADAVITDVADLGVRYHLTARVAGVDVVAEAHRAFDRGAPVLLCARPDRLHCFDARGDRRSDG